MFAVLRAGTPFGAGPLNSTQLQRFTRGCPADACPAPLCHWSPHEIQSRLHPLSATEIINAVAGRLPSSVGRLAVVLRSDHLDRLLEVRLSERQAT